MILYANLKIEEAKHLLFDVVRRLCVKIDLSIIPLRFIHINLKLKIETIEA